MSLKKHPSFSEAFQELEQIAAWFDQEEIDLEKSLTQFGRALELAKICRTSLNTFDLKLKELKQHHEDAYDHSPSLDSLEP